MKTGSGPAAVRAVRNKYGVTLFLRMLRGLRRFWKRGGRVSSQDLTPFPKENGAGISGAALAAGDAPIAWSVLQKDYHPKREVCQGHRPLALKGVTDALTSAPAGIRTRIPPAASRTLYPVKLPGLTLYTVWESVLFPLKGGGRG